MNARLMPFFVSAFVFSYALDAALSLAAEALRVLTGSMLLAGPQAVIAGLVLLWSLMWLPVLWLTPRLPQRLMLVLVGSTLWLGTGATPVVLFVPIGKLALVLSALQFGIAVSALVWIRSRSAGTRWLRVDDWFAGPFFSLRHSAVATAVSVFVFAPLLVGYALYTLATWVEVGTSGFVSADLTGVSLDDRRYVRGDREIRLVGMMHIGEGEAYRAIVESFATEATIVLEEGVSDSKGDLEETLSYERAAQALGLERQASMGSYLADPNGQLPEWPVLQRADLDMSDFSAVTVEWLAWVGRLWDSNAPMDAFRQILSRGSVNEEELRIVQSDILDLRNEHLLAEIDRVLPEYERVIVPWGALHLPFIEAAILERGFDEASRERRRLMSWATLLAALP